MFADSLKAATELQLRPHWVEQMDGWGQRCRRLESRNQFKVKWSFNSKASCCGLLGRPCLELGRILMAGRSPQYKTATGKFTYLHLKRLFLTLGVLTCSKSSMRRDRQCSVCHDPQVRFLFHVREVRKPRLAKSANFNLLHFHPLTIGLSAVCSTNLIDG